jgi:Uma2 family endonuclease
MTLEQFRQLPEGPPYFELIDGEVIMSAAPNLYHQEIVFNIAKILDADVRQHDLGKVLVSPVDVILGEDCFEPDVLYASRETLARVARPEALHGAPELLVEVLSESTYRRDLTRKRVKYAAAGVTEYWVVDPDERTLRHFIFAANQGEPVAVYAEGAVFESALFPGLRIAIADIFTT